MKYEEIHQVLYSAIRNGKHLKVRKKGYLHQTLRLVYIILFKKRHPVPLNAKRSLINDCPENIPLNFNGSEFNEIRISYQHPYLKLIFVIEIFLNLAFLFKLIPLQKFLFWISEILATFLIKRYKVRAILCGHPTILMTFFGILIKKNNGLVITAQHGIYSLGDYQVLWFEKNVATHVMVYGKYFGKLYIKQGTSPENIVIGSPYFDSAWTIGENPTKKIHINNRKVLFLGQQLYKISDSVFQTYNDFISKLILFYKSKNITIYYKPHPRESINSSLNKINQNDLKMISSIDSPDEFDIFYSVNSSLLLELYLQKNVCFQVNISIPDFNYDFFDSYTGIPLIDIEMIKNHLDIDSYFFYYDDNYINVQKPDTMGKKIENILSNIKELPQ
jgi:hypothetical protein